MSNRKNYNSIVFLTTLSVYLGLVLVGGATPSVLAQAATTRDFNIKNEIVVEDDLDKKPDEDLFADSIVGLVQELDKLSRKKSFDWNTTDTFQIEGLGICESDNSPAFMGSGSINLQVDAALEKTAFEIAQKLYKQKALLGLGNVHSHETDFDFIFDGGSLEIKAKISNASAVASERERDVFPFYNHFSGYLEKINSTRRASKNKIVAENTKVTTENNQVFIVTRLPRASIDDLLAEK
jgi:hypothetical protein